MSEEFEPQNCGESDKILSLSRNDIALLDPFRFVRIQKNLYTFNFVYYRADPTCDSVGLGSMEQRVIRQPIRGLFKKVFI